MTTSDTSEVFYSTIPEVFQNLLFFVTIHVIAWCYNYSCVKIKRQNTQEKADDDEVTDSLVYWEPGSDCGSIYEQLAQNKFKELIRNQIRSIK